MKYYTRNGLSPANALAYDQIIYKVNNTLMRNSSLDVTDSNWNVVASCSTWTPEQWSNFTFVYNACGDLRPNADIAGVGVVLAFMITAAITVLACIFRGLCLAELDTRDTWFNRLMFPKSGPRFEWMSRDRAKFWSPILGKLLIGLADQQMVTGNLTIAATMDVNINTRQVSLF